MKKHRFKISKILVVLLSTIMHFWYTTISNPNSPKNITNFRQGQQFQRSGLVLPLILRFVDENYIDICLISSLNNHFQTEKTENLRPFLKNKKTHIQITKLNLNLVHINLNTSWTCKIN